jgi:hypothetical protein
MTNTTRTSSVSTTLFSMYSSNLTLETSSSRTHHYVFDDDSLSFFGHTLGGSGKGIPKEREVDRRREVCVIG